MLEVCGTLSTSNHVYGIDHLYKMITVNNGTTLTLHQFRHLPSFIFFFLEKKQYVLTYLR